MSAPAPPPGARGLAALIGALTALPALSIDMSLPALPDLAGGFGAGAGDAQLSIGLFLLGFAFAQPACGPLSDRFGRRLVLLGGLGLSAAAGLCCALAPSLTFLLACRVLQGVGARAGTVLARAVIRDLFSGEAAAAKLSQVTAIMALGPVLAPAAGALVHAASGWRAIFLLLGCGGLALLTLAVCGRAELPAVVGLVALYTFARGMVVPAAAAEPMRHAAGLASGLLGALQMAGAALAASSVGLFGGPLVGMGATLALFGAAALLCGVGAEGVVGRCAPALAAAARRLS